MKPTQPVKPTSNITALLLSMSQTGFQGGRKLGGESLGVWTRMVSDPDCTIFMGLSGAMIPPAGMQNVLIELVKHRYVDVIVSTGANIFHDTCEHLGVRHYLGHHHADDEALFAEGDRPDLRRLRLRRGVPEHRRGDRPVRRRDSTVPGGLLTGVHPPPRELAPRTAAGRPVARRHLRRIRCPDLHPPRPLRLVHRDRPRDGTPARGGRRRYRPARRHRRDHPHGRGREEDRRHLRRGGVPKNFIQQTQVIASIHDQNLGGHAYAIQYTTDAPHWGGGLSGCTFEEAISWGGKEAPESPRVQCFCDATIALPIVASGGLIGSGVERARQAPPAVIGVDARAHASQQETIMKSHAKNAKSGV